MQNYSQNSEQKYILEFFQDTKGIFLDIGAYDGINLSNTRALAELGWHGVCVEPNDKIFEKLCFNYKDYKNVYCYEYAIGSVNGEYVFYNNDTYYSTLSEKEVKRWVSDTTITFTQSKVEVLDFNSFLEKSVYKKFDFISIDAEGVDYDILKQMDLRELGCKMICIEHNGVDTEKYIKYMERFLFKTKYINAENLLMYRVI